MGNNIDAMKHCMARKPKPHGIEQAYVNQHGIQNRPPQGIHPNARIVVIQNAPVVYQGVPVGDESIVGVGTPVIQ